MKAADFEEPEYRGPLFNQIEWGNHLVWEPGQVFENHIGIDRASFCTNHYIWNLHGFPTHPIGVILNNYRFPYIWNQRKKNKSLPNFALNLFIQAKRPYYLSTGTKILKKNNIPYSCWKFEITVHQQIALEKLSQKLSTKALVTYASPAFHKQKDLYTHTADKSIVENSTFPEVIRLSGHLNWYYDRPGAAGVANPNYEYIETPDLNTRIIDLVEKKEELKHIKIAESLKIIAKEMITITDILKDDFVSFLFAQELINIDRYIENFDLKENIEEVRDYLIIETFCFYYKLKWFTIG